MEELLAAATHKTKSEIEQLLAERFPRPDVPTRLQPIAPGSPQVDLQQAPELIGAMKQHAPWRIEEQLDLDPVESSAAHPKVAPLSPQRFALQVTIDQSTHDKLRYAQELLRHQVPSGDITEVLDRALDALVQKLEKRKFAATSRPRQNRRRRAAEADPTSASGRRHIRAEVKRAVWERDQGQCTFVGEAGHRCPARGS